MADYVPIFVRHISRSGGTLVTTILDAHPDVAMSYEIYENVYRTDFNKFMIYAGRSGLTPEEIFKETGGGQLLPFQAIENIAKRKMVKEGKKRWGAKCSSVEKYLQHWPEAKIISVIRNGYDNLASQLNTGAFNPDPFLFGKAWNGFLAGCKQYDRQYPDNHTTLWYDELVANPRRTAKVLFRWLGIRYYRKVLNFHRMDLTVHKTNHITGPKLKKPVNRDSVERWRVELSPTQAHEFIRGVTQSTVESCSETNTK